MRKCGFCKTEATKTRDDAEAIEYLCPNCGATEWISKGTGGAWWYHGWKAADGRKLRAPTVGEMRAGNYDWQVDDGN